MLKDYRPRSQLKYGAGDAMSNEREFVAMLLEVANNLLYKDTSRQR
jgi:hypothetical protein